MRTEIQNITVVHPELGELQKKIIITYDDHGNEITRENYVELAPPNIPDLLSQQTPEQLQAIANAIKKYL